VALRMGRSYVLDRERAYRGIRKGLSLMLDLEDRRTRWAVGTTIVLIMIVIVLALYGYYTGAWEAANAPN
jgi:hypothetical protein